MLDPLKILAGVPSGLRDPLIKSFQKIGSNYLEHRWEPAELNGGKFCEIAYTMVSGCLKGQFPAIPAKPKDMVAACRALEMISSNPQLIGDRSLRILIPRSIQVLYEIRNNRGVGHVGGDVDPNFLDATAVYAMSSWIFAELIRIFHAISTSEAQDTIDALIERKHPLIWEVEDIKRVLDPTMGKNDQVLLLLHTKTAWVTEKDLVKWVEYSNLSVFRKRILKPLHKARLVEYDILQGRVRITPLGIKEVEQRIIKNNPK